MASNALSPVAERIARRYAGSFGKNLNSRIDREDFLPVALFAAWDAERRFDPARGAKLENWIKGKVWNALLQHVRDQDHLKRMAREQVRRGIAPPHYGSPVSLEALRFEDDDEARFERSLAFAAPAEIYPDGYTAGLIREEVRCALRLVGAQRREVVVRHDLLGEPLVEIAKSCQRSSSRVKQLRDEAFSKLREVIQP